MYFNTTALVLFLDSHFYFSFPITYLAVVAHLQSLLLVVLPMPVLQLHTNYLGCAEYSRIKECSLTMKSNTVLVYYGVTVFLIPVNCSNFCLILLQLSLNKECIEYCQVSSSCCSKQLPACGRRRKKFLQHLLSSRTAFMEHRALF